MARASSAEADSQDVADSKFLSYVLRHHPEAVGFALDANGWVLVDDLLAACARADRAIDRQRLLKLVTSSDKQRFALSPDGLRIRGNQGHSVAVELGLDPTSPPALLYHGTVARFLPAITRKGLQRQGRHHVHLSPDAMTARRVGQRRGEPVVLTVRAADMAAAGHVFFRTANDVWLTAAVPPQYLEMENFS